MEDAKYQALVAEMQQMRNDFVSQMTELRAEVAQLKEQVTGKVADQGTQERNSHNGPDEPFVTHAASTRVVAASRIHEKKPFDWDLFIRAWLPRIFIFVLLLGVVFGFVAAVKAGYLTEPIRLRHRLCGGHRVHCPRRTANFVKARRTGTSADRRRHLHPYPLHLCRQSLIWFIAIHPRFPVGSPLHRRRRVLFLASQIASPGRRSRRDRSWFPFW